MIRVPIFFLSILLFASSAAKAENPKSDSSTINDSSLAESLANVQDVTELSVTDAEPYYALLHKADTVSQAVLWREAKEFLKQRQEKTGLPPFPDMLKNPQAYRGQPVQLAGHVLQTLKYEAEENPFGIETLYESQLYTEDSQQNPTTIVFLEKPDDLPLGSDLVDGVSVAGYFLKVYIYPSVDKKMRKGPLILAKTVQVHQIPNEPIVPPVVAYIGIGLAAVVIAGGAWLALKSGQRSAKQIVGDEPPDFTALSE